MLSFHIRRYIISGISLLSSWYKFNCNWVRVQLSFLKYSNSVSKDVQDVEKKGKDKRFANLVC